MEGNTIGPDNNLSFGVALERLLWGRKVARAGWNGKGMWLCFTSGRTINSGDFWSDHTKAYARENGGSAEVGSYLSMKSAQGTIEMGWKPTSMDMFATDWEVVE